MIDGVKTVLMLSGMQLVLEDQPEWPHPCYA